MNYTTEHTTWYKAYVSLIGYLKSKGIDLKDIVGSIGILPEEARKGFSEANLKRYRQDIKGTRVERLTKLVSLIEACFDIRLDYKDGLPQLSEYGEVIVKDSKVKSSSSFSQPIYESFNCYYVRSDRKVGRAILQLDLEKDNALFTLFYRGEDKLSGRKIQLAGKWKMERAVSEGKLDVFVTVYVERNDIVRKMAIPTNIFFYLQNNTIDKIQTITGTYISFSRGLGTSVAGLIVAKRGKILQNDDTEISEITQDNFVTNDNLSPFIDEQWIGNYLHDKRIIAENIYNEELDDYLQNSSFPESYSSLGGKYVGYYIRTTGITPTFERFALEMYPDGTAKMEVSDSPAYNLYFRKVATRLIIGYLESERPGDGEISFKGKSGKWNTYSRVTFAFHNVEGVNQILLYGIYGGIEYANSSPISGRIVLRKLSDEENPTKIIPQSFSLSEQFYTSKDTVFNEPKELISHIEAYLHGDVLPQYTDYQGAEKIAANLPSFLIGKFLCFSIFTEEDNDNNFKIGKYPLEITYPNNVVLQGRTLVYVGKASFSNNFLVLDLASNIENDQIRMAFRVRGSRWDHVYGTSLGRRGVNPEARAEVLLKMSDHFGSSKDVFKYHESYFFEQPENIDRTDTKSYSINIKELEKLDSRFANVVNFLRGEYNRYICAPYGVPDYEFDYDTRVKSERRAPFYAACHVFSKMDIKKNGLNFEDEIECMNFIKKANFHGFGLEQNFGDKHRFDEKKLRNIKQFELEIQEERKELDEFRHRLLDLKDLKPIRILQLIDTLWPPKQDHIIS